MIQRIIHTLNSFQLDSFNQQTVPIGVLDLSKQSNLAKCNFVNNLNVKKIYAYVIDARTSGGCSVIAYGNDGVTQVSGGVINISGSSDIGTSTSVTPSGNASFTADQRIQLCVASAAAYGKAIFLAQCTVTP
jgi:hypothetical protein